MTASLAARVAWHTERPHGATLRCRFQACLAGMAEHTNDHNVIYGPLLLDDLVIAYGRTRPIPSSDQNDMQPRRPAPQAVTVDNRVSSRHIVRHHDPGVPIIDVETHTCLVFSLRCLPRKG